MRLFVRAITLALLVVGAARAEDPIHPWTGLVEKHSSLDRCLYTVRGEKDDGREKTRCRVLFDRRKGIRLEGHVSGFASGPRLVVSDLEKLWVCEPSEGDYKVEEREWSEGALAEVADEDVLAQLLVGTRFEDASLHGGTFAKTDKGWSLQQGSQKTGVLVELDLGARGLVVAWRSQAHGLGKTVKDAFVVEGFEEPGAAFPEDTFRPPQPSPEAARWSEAAARHAKIERARYVLECRLTVNGTTESNLVRVWFDRKKGVRIAGEVGGLRKLVVSDLETTWACHGIGEGARPGGEDGLSDTPASEHVIVRAHKANRHLTAGDLLKVEAENELLLHLLLGAPIAGAPTKAKAHFDASGRLERWTVTTESDGITLLEEFRVTAFEEPKEEFPERIYRYAPVTTSGK